MNRALTRISGDRSRVADKTFAWSTRIRDCCCRRRRMTGCRLARLIAELVDEHLDLLPIRAAYTGGRAAPPCDPRLMVRILLYGYTTGVRSSRAIEPKCVDDVPFRWLAAGAAPDYRAIARFRKRHLSALGYLFVEALALCRAAGMVRLGRVALDGTRVRDNAATRKGMSYARMRETERVLAEEVWALLADADSIDEAEDTTLGKIVAVTSRQSSCGDAQLGWPRSARATAWRPRLDSRSGSGPLRNRRRSALWSARSCWR